MQAVSAVETVKCLEKLSCGRKKAKKLLPEHTGPASSGPDGVGEDWVDPCSHEEGVQNVRLELGALSNGSRHNGAGSGSKLRNCNKLRPGNELVYRSKYREMEASKADLTHSGQIRQE